MFRAPSLIAAALVLAGCSGIADPVVLCTQIVQPAVIVEIRDLRTGAPIAGSASGVVRDGAYVDSLRPYGYITGPLDAQSLYSRQAAPERAGVYEISIQRAGYRAWDTTGVRVTREECHVNTATIRANLVAAP